MERTIPASGTTVRLLLEQLSGGRVRVLEYHRRRGEHGRFERVRAEEGMVCTFDKLGLDQPFEAVFPQPGLFDGAPSHAAPPAPRRGRK